MIEERRVVAQIPLPPIKSEPLSIVYFVKTEEAMKHVHSLLIEAAGRVNHLEFRGRAAGTARLYDVSVNRCFGIGWRVSLRFEPPARPPEGISIDLYYGLFDMETICG